MPLVFRLFLLSFFPSVFPVWNKKQRRLRSLKIQRTDCIHLKSIFSSRLRPYFFRKVCVHCKSDRSEHELPPNQALNVYNRLGIQPPGTSNSLIVPNRKTEKGCPTDRLSCCFETWDSSIPTSCLSAHKKFPPTSSNIHSFSAGMPQSGVAETEVPGSVGHGYAWVPPGLSRKKVSPFGRPSIIRHL